MSPIINHREIQPLLWSVSTNQSNGFESDDGESSAIKPGIAIFIAFLAGAFFFMVLARL
jgi:hypothetical protein